MSHLNFYDLPVYRLSRDAYYAARDTHIEKVLFRTGTSDEQAMREREKLNPRINDAFRNHLECSFGGCWEYNEIIGYIRLHFLGSQVRGEYFAVLKKRVTKTRTKTFEYKTWKLAPEVDVEHPYGTIEVLQAIRQYIEDCKKEVPRRYIDTSRFEVLAPHVDWEGVFRNGL
jgi:hypothetical protein